MDDRALAISILERAREILAARLTERIIEASDEIIDDALGNSYSSEIESLHEQVGLILNHVTSMLTSLPPTTTQDHSGTAGDAGRVASETIEVGDLPEPLDG